MILSSKNVLEKIPCRLVIVIMIFLSGFINYTMRVNLSVILIAMVPRSNETFSPNQYKMDWTTYQRAQVLASFFWGYLVGGIISLLITDLLRPRQVLIVLTLMVSTLTLLSPTAAQGGYIYLMIIRVAIGIFNGFLFPSLNIIISRWAVENEKSRFISSTTGGTIGTFFAWTVCGLILEKFGWKWGFYCFGLIGLLATAIFYLCLFDDPNQHPRITSAEKEYIHDGIKNVKDTRKMAPYLKIFTSIPCWSLFISEFGLGWGIYFVITTAPHYLSKALGLNISSSSFLSALIYLVRCSSVFMFGYVGDLIKRRSLMTENVLRRLACVTSHILPGCALFCMTIQGYPACYYVILIVFAMGLNGSVILSSHMNVYDLTKNFIGCLSSVCIIMCTGAGIITPYVTAYFVKEDEENQIFWRPIFYIGATVYVISGLQFILLCSTKIQPWDH